MQAITEQPEQEQQQILENLQRKMEELDQIDQILIAKTFQDYRDKQINWVNSLPERGYARQNYDTLDALFDDFTFLSDQHDMRTKKFNRAFREFREKYSNDPEINKYLEALETKKFFCLLSLAFLSIHKLKNHSLSDYVHQLIELQMKNLHQEIDNFYQATERTLDRRPDNNSVVIQTPTSLPFQTNTHEEQTEKDAIANQTAKQKETPAQTARVGTYPQYTTSLTTTLLLFSSLGLSLLTIVQNMSPKFTLLLLGVHLSPVLLISLALATAGYGFYRMQSETKPGPTDNAPPASLYQQTLRMFGLSKQSAQAAPVRSHNFASRG